MREVNYFHCSIILHNDATIVIVIQLIHHRAASRSKSKTITIRLFLSHCILCLCRLCVRPRLMRTRCHCHCKWPLRWRIPTWNNTVMRNPYAEEYQNNSFPDFWENFAHVQTAETRLSLFASLPARVSERAWGPRLWVICDYVAPPCCSFLHKLMVVRASKYP